MPDRDPLLIRYQYKSSMIPPGSAITPSGSYQSLQAVLDAAYQQASHGKGAARHAAGEPFEKQKICEITRRLIGSPVQSLLYQAVKKIYETTRTDPIPEILGAINYLCAAVIVLQELTVPAPDTEQEGEATGEGPAVGPGGCREIFSGRRHA